MDHWHLAYLGMRQIPRELSEFELATFWPGFTRMSAGAAWDDLKLGIAHYWHWEAVALVTDHDWIRRAVDVFRFVVPAHIRTFPDDQAAEARDWIVSSLDKPATRPS